MARFSKPGVREKLEATGVTCIRHDLFEPFDDLADGYDYVFHSALPLARNAAGRVDVPSRDRWPNSFDAYADATGRLMAHFRPAKGFLFASTISVYDPPGGDTPVSESHPFGTHTTSAYSFTKVANEAVVSYLSRSLDIPATIIRVGSASGVDGGPLRDRLDRIVHGKPIRLHPDGPTYVRPMFEPDCAAARRGRARGRPRASLGRELVRRRSRHRRGVLHVHGRPDRPGADLRVHDRSRGARWWPTPPSCTKCSATARSPGARAAACSSRSCYPELVPSGRGTATDP